MCNVNTCTELRIVLGTQKTVLVDVVVDVFDTSAFQDKLTFPL